MKDEMLIASTHKTVGLLYRTLCVFDGAYSPITKAQKETISFEATITLPRPTSAAFLKSGIR